MILVAFRGEMRKMWKRPATWVTVGLFSFINFVDLFDEYRDARTDGGNPFSLPDAWVTILGGGEEMMMAFVFASVLLILLVAAEFTWRTARQNVIDGLSKTQWYSSKLLLIPLLAALFIGIRVVLGASLAWIGTDPSTAEALFGSTQIKAMSGMWLAGMGYASLAMFVAAAIRSSGPSMALWFAWFAFGERLVIGGLGRLFEGLRPALRWLPMSTFNRLTNYIQYDSEAMRRAAEMAAEHDRTIPSQLALQPAVIGTLAWIAALAIGGWLWYRRRDL